MKKKPQRSLASLLPKTADASPRMTKATDDLLARTAGRRKQLYLAYSLAPPADALWHLATWQSFAEDSLAESTREADKTRSLAPPPFPVSITPAPKMLVSLADGRRRGAAARKSAGTVRTAELERKVAFYFLDSTRAGWSSARIAKQIYPMLPKFDCFQNSKPWAISTLLQRVKPIVRRLREETRNIGPEAILKRIRSV